MPWFATFVGEALSVTVGAGVALKFTVALRLVEPPVPVQVSV